jgi:hypothetical protein
MEQHDTGDFVSLDALPVLYVDPSPLATNDSYEHKNHTTLLSLNIESRKSPSL